MCRTGEMCDALCPIGFLQRGFLLLTENKKNNEKTGLP